MKAEPLLDRAVRQLVLRETNLTETQFDKLPKYVRQAFTHLAMSFANHIRQHDEQMEELRREFGRKLNGRG